MYIDLKVCTQFLVTSSDVFYTYTLYALFLRALCI